MCTTSLVVRHASDYTWPKFELNVLFFSLLQNYVVLYINLKPKKKKKTLLSTFYFSRLTPSPSFFSFLLYISLSAILPISFLFFSMPHVFNFVRYRPKVSSALFFNYNTSMGLPYRVLVDTNFINFSIQNKVSD